MAENSPKTAFFRLFFDFLEHCPYDSNEIFYIHSKPYYGPLCAISIHSYAWNVRTIAKTSQKWPKNSRFPTFFDFRKNSCNVRSRRLKNTKIRLKIRNVRFKIANPAGTENRQRSRKTHKKHPHPARERTSRHRSIPEIAVRCHLPRKTSQPKVEPEEWPKR